METFKNPGRTLTGHLVTLLDEGHTHLPSKRKPTSPPAHPPIEWTRLFALAEQVRRLAPWGWMSDDMLLGVRDRATGETAWVCILGHAGELFGVCAYLGHGGYDFYARMQTGVLDPQDAMFEQDALVLTFGNKSDLQPEERELIQSLGVQCKGRAAWPAALRHSPGYVPGLLSATELARMNDILEQVLEVAPRVRSSPLLLDVAPAGGFLERVPVVEDGQSRWQDVRTTPPAKPVLVIPSPDRLRLERLRESATASDACLDCDFFAVQAPIQESADERPWVPTAQLLVDSESGHILHTSLGRYGDRLADAQHELMALLEEHKVIPAELRVSRRLVHAALRPVAAALDCRLSLCADLRQLDRARKGLLAQFSER